MRAPIPSLRASLAAAALAVLPLAALADDPPTATPTPAPAAEAGEADEEIVVTATRGPRGIRGVPAAVDVVGASEMARSPTKTVDELLKGEPSFTNFRRSSSMAADPSSQGVKLRNVASSGVSRTLVLVDGVPANDAFGGWVAWRALPRIGLDRIEVVPGGGSSLYGNYALGGVVQAFSSPIRPTDVDVTADYGSFGTGAFAARAADRRGPVGASVETELLRSDGYNVAAPCPAATRNEQCRGSIDQLASSEHATVRGRLEGQAAQNLTLDARGGYFWEDLNGGTKYTTAGVRRFDYAAGAHWTPEDAGNVDLNVFGHHGEFTQDRARVNPARTTESQSAHQDVPADDVGATLVWRARPFTFAGTHAVTVGTDGRWIDGETREQLFPAPGPPPDPATAATTVVQRNAGGQQRLYGLFAQDLYDLTQAIGVSLAVRYDHWENLGGSRVETMLDGHVEPTPFGDRSGDVLSPKIGLTARLAPWASARAAAYRAFRAPTLDELYRPFQVGPNRTEANENLVPEKLRGVEAGLDLGARRGAALRVTGFYTELTDPIVNATTGPNTARRENLGKARVEGVEADASWTFARRWLLGAAYTLAATKITEAPGQPLLVGQQLPQAPRHLATFSLGFDDPRLLTASVQLRYLGDQNERLPAPNQEDPRRLGDAWLTDVFAAWHLGARLDLYLAVENLFDETYLVGRAGLDTIGQPRFVHGGVRMRVGG